MHEIRVGKIRQRHFVLELALDQPSLGVKYLSPVSYSQDETGAVHLGWACATPAEFDEMCDEFIHDLQVLKQEFRRRYETKASK